ncbi:MAG: hypothetical protein HY720_05520 [Planctomycetes bacterium]|nr:hypothetical protein [Planctomycetota bacterium]
MRVRVRLQRGTGASTRELETVALVNTGFEADKEDASLPAGAAARLGLWPPPPEAKQYVVRSYGSSIQIERLENALRVLVTTPDRSGPEITAHLLLTGADDEVVLSDSLSQALGIVPLEPRDGVWCFHDEIGTRRRPSEPPEVW